MGLFTKKTSLPTSGHAGDDQLLAMINKSKRGLGVTRHWIHYVYAANEQGAAHLEASAVTAGWAVRRVSPEYHGIVAERSDLAVDPDSVAAVRTFFERLASEIDGGEYDGWEADAS